MIQVFQCEHILFGYICTLTIHILNYIVWLAPVWDIHDPMWRHGPKLCGRTIAPAFDHADGRAL